MQLRVSGLQVFRQWAINELVASGYRPLVLTRVVRMQAEQGEMNLVDQSARLVFDVISPERARTKNGKRKITEPAQLRWVVVEMCGLVIGRTFTRGQTTTVTPFASREDACTYARFPPSGSGAHRVVEYIDAPSPDHAAALDRAHEASGVGCAPGWAIARAQGTGSRWVVTGGGLVDAVVDSAALIDHLLGCWLPEAQHELAPPAESCDVTPGIEVAAVGEVVRRVVGIRPTTPLMAILDDGTVVDLDLSQARVMP